MSRTQWQIQQRNNAQNYRRHQEGIAWSKYQKSQHNNSSGSGLGGAIVGASIGAIGGPVGAVLGGAVGWVVGKIS